MFAIDGSSYLVLARWHAGHWSAPDARVRRGVRNTSSGDTQMSPTRHTAALSRTIAADACTTTPASALVSARRVVTTRPRCQKASVIPWSTKMRKLSVRSRGESLKVSVRPPRSVDGAKTPLVAPSLTAGGVHIVCAVFLTLVSLLHLPGPSESGAWEIG
jgi:hypothetical protein